MPGTPERSKRCQKHVGAIARLSSALTVCGFFVVGDRLLLQPHCHSRDFPRDLIHAFRTAEAPSHLAITLLRTTKLASCEAAGGQPPPCSVRKRMLMRRTVAPTVLTLPCLPCVLMRIHNCNMQGLAYDQASPGMQALPTASDANRPTSACQV